MSKIGFWKNIFGHKEKVVVDVGDKTELLTHTQSFRFSELAEKRDTPREAACRYLLDDERYRLDDAAYRLRIPEDEVLAKGAAGDLRLYVDVAGQSGHWRLHDKEGNVSQSTVSTIQSGLLKLQTGACGDLAKHGRAIVRALDLCTVNGHSRAGIDDDTLANLRAWGPGAKRFFPLHPLTIEPGMIVLLSPLD